MIRWQGRIYESWPNRICCYLAGLDMLEKESIYCCLSGGPPRLNGLGEFLGFRKSEVRSGGLQGPLF